MISPMLLKTFCTLAEVGHFTKTAEKLHMTQSGVSQHIRKLEEVIGQPLLVRQGKQFSLTEAGSKLQSEGNEILEALGALKRSVTEDPALEGVVRVMLPGSLGLSLYPLLLEEQVRHPGLKMDVRFAPNASIEQAVAQSDVDFGIMTRQARLPEVRSKAMGMESLRLVTPANVRKVTWERLLSLGFIDHPDGAHHADLLLSEHFPEFEHVSQFMVNGFSNQIGLILDPVSLGLGFTVLPAHAVNAYPQAKSIRVHELPKNVSEPLYLIHHKTRPLAKRIERIVNLVSQWLAE